jgi:hypothetical protein
MEPIVARGIEFDEDGARTPFRYRVFYRFLAMCSILIALAVAANGDYMAPVARWGLFLGAVAMTGGGMVTARSRVDIYDDEIRIVNGFRVHQIPRALWGEFRQERRLGIETGIFEMTDGRQLRSWALQPGGYSLLRRERRRQGAPARHLSLEPFTPRAGGSRRCLPRVFGSVCRGRLGP